MSTAFSVVNPVAPFLDIDGQPLDGGYIYVGAAGLNAETNPITVYWDKATNIPASQPLRTKNGFVIRAGAYANVYARVDYSMTVKNRNGTIVSSAANAWPSFGTISLHSELSDRNNAGSHTSDAISFSGRSLKSKLEDSVSVKDYGAVGDGVADDTAACQAAIDYAAGASIRRVVFPAGTYKLTSAGSVSIPASDDGTGTATAYNGSTVANIAAEAVNTQAYCLKVPASSGIRLCGDGRGATILSGPYSISNGASTSYPAAVVIDGEGGSYFGTDQYTWGGISGIRFWKFFIGVYAANAFAVECDFNDVLFYQCGISSIFRFTERCRFEKIHTFAGVSGMVFGGFWQTRCDNYTEGGGWTDKNSFRDITGQSFTPMSNSTFGAIDSYYDTYYFKTANNTTRKYPAGSSGTPATSEKYRGISGRTISIFSRYYRPNASNVINGSLTHMFSTRPALNLAAVSVLAIDNIYIEGCGRHGGTASGPIAGDPGYEDPYISGRYPDLVSSGFTAFGGVRISSLEVQNSAALRPVPLVDDFANMEIGCARAVNVSATQSNSIGGNLPNTWEDYGEEKILASKTWGADQNTGGHRFGQNIYSSVVNTAAGHAIASIQLPVGKWGVYMLSVYGSPNGDVANRRSGVYVVTWVYDDDALLHQLQTTQLGTDCFNAGSAIKPTALTVSAPDGAGIVTVDFTVAGATCAIAADVIRVA